MLVFSNNWNKTVSLYFSCASFQQHILGIKNKELENPNELFAIDFIENSYTDFGDCYIGIYLPFNFIDPTVVWILCGQGTWDSSLKIELKKISIGAKFEKSITKSVYRRHIMKRIYVGFKMSLH